MSVVRHECSPTLTQPSTAACSLPSSDVFFVLLYLDVELNYFYFLKDMGFTAAEAREALQFTNGDVEAAASYLAA